MAIAFSQIPEQKSLDAVFNPARVNFVAHTHKENASPLATEAYVGELSLLRQQSSQLETMIDVMPTGMILLDGNGVVVKINNVAKQLLDEPILGQPWFEVIQRSFKPRKDDWHEVSLKDGRRVKLEITALGDQPGQLIVITDLTETRLLQDKLRHLQKLSSLGQTVAKLAHQIRTPLSAAMLYGANLKNKALDAVSRDKFQNKMMSQLKSLEQQVNDMLLFSKSGNEQVVEPLSVNEIIIESTADIDALVNQANAKVNINTCPNDCQILGNKSALVGALQNLIHNSLEVIKTGAEINIQAYCSKDSAFISVKDNGPGINDSLKDKVFEPFYTSRAQGTGLGLAVVKSVANAHQGEAFLLSKAGEGAHFCIQLPVLDKHAKSTKQENSHDTK